VGVDIIDGDKAALYCNTTDWAFGPVFDHAGDAVEFLEFASAAGVPDVRVLSNEDLSKMHGEWMVARQPRENLNPAAPCPECGGEPEECAKYGHEWLSCPRCGGDQRPHREACQDCGLPVSQFRR